METLNSNQINTGKSQKYYTHSGAFSVGGLIPIIISGTMAAVILGFIYSYAVHFIPFVYLNVFLTMGFGFCMGLIVSFGGKRGKIRNTSVVGIFGVIFGLLAEYSQLVFWIFAESKQKLFLIAPSDVFDMMKTISINGLWRVRSITPTGGLLFFIWFVEAAIIVGLTIISAIVGIKSEPFCEKCKKWVDKEESLDPINFPNSVEGLKRQLEQGNFSELTNLGKADKDKSKFITVEIRCCEECKDFSLMSLKANTITKNEKGEEKTTKEEVIENLIIDKEVYDSLKSWNETTKVLTESNV